MSCVNVIIHSSVVTSLCHAVLYNSTKFRRHVTICASHLSLIRHLGFVIVLLDHPRSRVDRPKKAVHFVSIGLHQFPRYVNFSLPSFMLESAYSRSVFWEDFRGFDPLNVVACCGDPQKVSLRPWPETHVLTYRSSRSIKQCYLGVWPRNKKKETKLRD